MESKKLEKPCENATFQALQGVMKPDEETGGVFPTMDIMGNYGEEPILIWQSSPRGRGRRRAKCKIIALEGGIENG